MKKIQFMIATCVIATTSGASAAYSDRQFRNEIISGLDIISARANAHVVPDAAPGELGQEVYQVVGAVNTREYGLFIPTSMYVRAGGGLNLGFASAQATYADKKHNASGGWATQIGVGWNLSSYVRTELDFQESTLRFSDVKNHDATTQTLGATLLFDLRRRYIQTGDVTQRRVFVPFIGVGVAGGHYEFQGTDGADGFMIAAPRATAGFNVALTDLIGIDIAYQYQLMISNGFGWGDGGNTARSISNIMASFRINF